MADFKTWYRSQTPEEKEAYAQRAGTTTKYIEKRLMYRKRVPRPKLLQSLAAASLGRLTYDDVIQFFLKIEEADKAA